jgi:RNA polymerase sigma factor (sigma-70 family)
MSEHTRLSFEDLYSREYPRIYRRVLAMVKRPELAQDLAQETFVKAWRAWPPTSQKNLSGWLSQIATRTALDVLRQEYLIAWQPLDGLDWQLVHPTADPQTRYEGEANILDAALSHLPAQARRLLLWSADSTARELAQTLGVNPRTLASQLSRLKAQARQLYQEEARHG